MDPSGLKLTAYVKFLPIRECDLDITLYVSCLIGSFWSEVVSGTLSNYSMTVLVQLCQSIVNLSSINILHTIRSVTSDWHRKAPRIYTHVSPEECFFGIDESDVLANMKNILPQGFADALNSVRRVPCASLEEFSQLAAKQVTDRINSQIASIMDIPLFINKPMGFGCNCISFITLHTMIGLMSKVLRCFRQNECHCTPVSRTSERASTILPLHNGQATEMPLRRVVEQGPCDIIYSTFYEEVMDILTELTKRCPPVVENQNSSLLSDDSFTWLSSESADIVRSAGFYITGGSDNDSGERTVEERQSSDHTDPQDSSEDLISPASVETIDTETSETSFQTVSLGSPCEDQPDDSAAEPAVSSDTCSSEPATSSDEDTMRKTTSSDEDTKRKTTTSDEDTKRKTKTSDEDTMRKTTRSDEDTKRKTKTSDEDTMRKTTTSDEDTNHRLVFLLLTGFLLHSTKKARTSQPQVNFKRVIKNLSDKAMREIEFHDIVISSNRQTVKKICKALFRDLCQQFGSAEVFLTAMATQDPAADDLVIQALKTHLTAPSPTPKKNAIVRFFSSVGKAIVKPFRACFSARSSS